jgi:proteasome activator subunit 4
MQLCTTAFIVEISQYIMIGELSTPETGTGMMTDGTSTPVEKPDPRKLLKIPSFNLTGIGFFQGNEAPSDTEPRLSRKEEDAQLVATTGSFADWVAGFIRRVILLLENLPEEGVLGNNYSDGSSECTCIL